MSEFWWAIVRSWLFSFSTILWKICCCRIFLLLHDSALVKQLDVWEMGLHQTLDYFDIQWCPGYKISPNYHPCVTVLDSYYEVLMLICSVCLSPNSWHCLLWLNIPAWSSLFKEHCSRSFVFAEMNSTQYSSSLHGIW